MADKTLNPLRRALAEATDGQVAELLSPFEVKTFAELHRKYQDLCTFKRVALKEQEQARKAEVANVERKEASKILNKAGVKVNENEALLDAYLKLSEEKRGEFVKALMPKPMSTLRGGAADIGGETKKLDEKAKAALVSNLPHPTL